MKILLIAGAFLWLLAAVGGMFYLSRYETTPGETVAAYPAAFPALSELGLDVQRPTLIFFAHPKCPCTRASLHELARLMADTGGRLKAYVVFIKPQGEGDEWMATPSVAEARAIPGVEVITDENERESGMFKAETSGLVLVYDRAGALRFNGGITSARAHEGDNAGRQAIFDIVTLEAGSRGETLVFGCPLHKKDCDGELMQAAN